MGGIVGLIGEGSVAELESMAARAPYRGRVRAWSPAPRVYLGELSLDAHAPDRPAGCMAVDTAGQTTAREDIERLLSAHSAAAAANLRGFFAIAWWDEQHQSLKFICDRHGYKTLYIARLPGRIAFASDLKALLALHDMPAAVDRDVLQMYLRSRSFPSERSLLAAATPIGGRRRRIRRHAPAPAHVVAGSRAAAPARRTERAVHLHTEACGAAFVARPPARLWALICAELWLRQLVDQRGVTLDTSRISTAREPISVPAIASASQPAPIP